MSRRRGEPKRSSVEGSFVTIKVVCTGKRTHPEVSFGQVDVFPDLRDEWGGGVNIHLDADEFFVEGQPADWNDPAATRSAMHTTHTLRCRRCQPARTVPLTGPTLEAIATGLATRDERRLDISALGAVGPISSKQ